MFIEELVKFGLSEKEAKTYLALLELEVATVNEIAKAAGINRSSTYVVIESLQKRGLVSVSAGKKIKKYVVEPPERLTQIAEHVAQKHANIKIDLENILPDLKSLYKGTKQKPHVKIYEGKQGLINCFEETLKMKEKLMRVVSSSKDIQKSLPDYLPIYIEKRTKLGIVMHGIHPYDEMANYLREEIAHVDTLQLIPSEKWTFMSDFAIFDDTVSFMLHKDLIAISIDNKAVADGMKKIFDLAFEEAKRLNIKSMKTSSKPVTPR